MKSAALLIGALFAVAYMAVMVLVLAWAIGLALQ